MPNLLPMECCETTLMAVFKTAQHMGGGKVPLLLPLPEICFPEPKAKSVLQISRSNSIPASKRIGPMGCVCSAVT